MVPSMVASLNPKAESPTTCLSQYSEHIHFLPSSVILDTLAKDLCLHQQQKTTQQNCTPRSRQPGQQVLSLVLNSNHTNAWASLPRSRSNL